MIKVMVIGASAVLGNLVCSDLLSIFDNRIKLIITDYKKERGNNLANRLNNDVQFRYLDVNNEENIKQVIDNVDVVVVSVKQKTPHIQRMCIEKKIVCIDVTPFYEFAEEVMKLNERATKNGVSTVIMAGFFPGLSGLMIKEATANFDEVTEVNIGLLQNKNAKAGVSGMIDMLKIIEQPVKSQERIVPGFTKKRGMYFLNHAKEKQVRLIDHAEKLLLKDKFNTAEVNYWTAWNTSAFNKLVSILSRIGFTRNIHKINKKFLSGMVRHNPNKKEDVVLTVEVRGMVGNKERVKVISLSACSDYSITARATAALAKIASEKDLAGVSCPFDITNLGEIISEMSCSDIHVEVVEKSI